MIILDISSSLFAASPFLLFCVDVGGFMLKKTHDSNISAGASDSSSAPRHVYIFIPSTSLFFRLTS